MGLGRIPGLEPAALLQRGEHAGVHLLHIDVLVPALVRARLHAVHLLRALALVPVHNDAVPGVHTIPRVVQERYGQVVAVDRVHEQAAVARHVAGELDVGLTQRHKVVHFLDGDAEPVNQRRPPVVDDEFLTEAQVDHVWDFLAEVRDDLLLERAVRHAVRPVVAGDLFREFVRRLEVDRTRALDALRLRHRLVGAHDIRVVERHDHRRQGRVLKHLLRTCSALEHGASHFTLWGAPRVLSLGRDLVDDAHKLVLDQLLPGTAVPATDHLNLAIDEPASQLLAHLGWRQEPIFCRNECTRHFLGKHRRPGRRDRHAQTRVARGKSRRQ